MGFDVCFFCCLGLAALLGASTGAGRRGHHLWGSPGEGLPLPGEETPLWGGVERDSCLAGVPLGGGVSFSQGRSLPWGGLRGAPARGESP